MQTGVELVRRPSGPAPAVVQADVEDPHRFVERFRPVREPPFLAGTQPRKLAVLLFDPASGLTEFPFRVRRFAACEARAQVQEGPQVLRKVQD